jgi:hypothetical protein
MATGEDEAQALVRELVGLGILRAAAAQGLERLQRRPLDGERLFAADAVDRLVASDLGDPGTRVRRNAVVRPALEGDDERLLDRLLREVEVSDGADERRDRPPRLTPEQAVDDRGRAGGALDRRGGRGRAYDAAFSRSRGWT